MAPAQVESAWPFHQIVSSAQSRTAPIARRAAVLGLVKTSLANSLAESETVWFPNWF
jgi:hypothetical protein